MKNYIMLFISLFLLVIISCSKDIKDIQNEENSKVVPSVEEIDMIIEKNNNKMLLLPRDECVELMMVAYGADWGKKKEAREEYLTCRSTPDESGNRNSLNTSPPPKDVPVVLEK